LPGLKMRSMKQRAIGFAATQKMSLVVRRSSADGEQFSGDVADFVFAEFGVNREGQDFAAGAFCFG
jgi:hypothetical protein